VKKAKILVLCLSAGILGNSLAARANDSDIPGLLNRKDIKAVAADLDALVPGLMKEARIPGLQIALIRDGKIGWRRSFGVSNANTSVPVTDDTIFEAASLTKPFFAYYAMKLVDQDVIDLDKPLAGYLPQDALEEILGHPMDEKGFRRDWFEKITARQVLSHSSGMPHGESGRPYPLLFEPGTKWKYSAAGYFFLQRVVERLKGDKIENLMQKEVIGPLGMTNSCLVWRDGYEKTMANGHGFFGKPEEFRKRTEAHVAATLYTTAGDYAKFVCAVMNGTGLRPETQKEMLAPRIAMDKEKGIGWSLGFGTQSDGNGPAIWQWGDYGIFRNFVIAYPREKTAVVYFTNSYYGLGITPDLVARSVGGQCGSSAALGYWRYDSPVYRFAWELEAKGPGAVAGLKSLMNAHPGVFDRDATGFLIETFQEAGLNPVAIALLEFNAGENPRSGSAQVNLARAYLLKGDGTRARSILEKARAATEDKVEPAVIEWNMEHAAALENPVKLEAKEMEMIAGDYGARHIQLRDGRLYYFRESGTYPDPRPLAAMSRDTFLIEGVSNFRIKVEFDATGAPAKLIGLYEDGRRDETARTRSTDPDLRPGQSWF
jgi:CubicO group peptidase (beta-lactamase class C family)